MIKLIRNNSIPLKDIRLPRHRPEPDAAFGVLVDIEHYIAGEAVPCIVGTEGIAVEAGCAIVGAEPHVAAAILESAVDFGAGQAVLGGVVAEVGLGVGLGDEEKGGEGEEEG